MSLAAREVFESLGFMDDALAICRAYGVSLDDALGRSRFHDATMARHRLWYVLHTRAGMGYSAIGRVFERDHTTVLLAMRAWERCGEKAAE